MFASCELRRSSSKSSEASGRLGFQRGWPSVGWEPNELPGRSWQISATNFIRLLWINGLLEWYIYIYIYGGLIILGFFFWSGLGIIFGFLLLCFSAFPAFPASLLSCFSCFSCFSAFLLFCFSASPASLLFCFFAFLLLLLLCFSAFLLFCFACFFASLLFLLFLLLCFSAFPASLPFCCFAFVRFLFLCFSAFLLLCFFFALPALNTWFSCKMHFAQYLSIYIPEYHMTNLLLKTSNVTCEKRCLHSALGGGAAPSPQSPLPLFFYLNLNPSYISWFLRTNLLWKADRITCDR